jgi:3-oxoacyl-[acyl-carrier protein] reductase
METVTNKVALVTGASRGIGKAIALALAEEGIRIAVNYRSSKEEAERIVALITQKGGKALAVGADVSEDAQVMAMADRIGRELGAVDILINNAGVAAKRRIEETTESDFDDTIKKNLKSSFLVTQAVLPAMRKAGWGRIVMMSSLAAQMGGEVSLSYAASKAGQIGMMHFYARNLAKEGITVNAIAPAVIATDMVAQLGLSAAKIPLGRTGTTEEIAQAVVFLVKNAYITGQTINVNGGAYPSS